MKDRLELVVLDVSDVSGVRTLTLVDPREAPLPAYVPGSHVLLECGGRPNAYSLLDDGVAPMAYRISVLRTVDSAGGSSWIHGALARGDTVLVDRPRSAFAPVASARRHLMVAAGIGITPLLSHVRAALRWQRDFTLLYRHNGDGAHVDELTEICGRRLISLTTREAFRARLRDDLVTQPLGSHLYVCGPADFADLVLTTAANVGWPASRLHSERFNADVLDPGRTFTVRVGGDHYEVPSGTSLLSTLEANGYDVPNRCRQGVCGECLVQVRSGRPEHRDLYLSEEEREAGDCLLTCVSRSLDDVIEVAL